MDAGVTKKLVDNNNATGNAPNGATRGAAPQPNRASTPLFADVSRTPLTQTTQTLVRPSVSPVAPSSMSSPNTPLAPAQSPLPQNRSSQAAARNWRKAFIRSGVSLLALALVGAGLLLFNTWRERPALPQTSSAIESTNIPLSEFADSGSFTLLGGQSLIVNGQLRANESFVLAPQTQPATGERGQIYYDTNNDQLAYYNGTQFVNLPGTNFVQSFQGQSGNVSLTAGNGIAITGTTVTNNGVTSIGGQAGDISLGTGLTISGTTLQTTGVQTIVSGSPQLTVTNDGAGNYTVTSAAGGSGTVSSSGGTANTIPMFTAAQNIENSILTQSGTTITVGGSLNVTGALTLGTPLAVANGGTGASGLSTNGVIVGNGTSPLSSVTAAGAGLCLMSTGGAPAFSACPGSGGVSSLNGLTGALTLANATTSGGNTVTINDASTSAKGIAQFDATNFSASGGLINTIQNINTSATPTFAGLTLSGDLAVNGGDITSSGGLNITPGGTLVVGATTQTLTLQGGASTTLSATSGGNTTALTFQTPGANVNYRLATASAGSYDLCSTAGNCAGVGGGVTTAGGTLNRLAKFTAAQGIGDSTITDNGTSVSTTVDLIVQGGDITVGVANSQTGTLLFADGGSGFLGSIVQGALSDNRTYTLPNASGTFCLTSGNCSGSGSANTLQAAYDAGNGITTTNARDLDIVLANTSTDSNFDLVIADGSTGTASFSRANGGGTADPSQIILIDNLDTDRAVAAGIKLQAAAGGLTVALDASDAEIDTALATGDNNITGGTGNLDFTNFDVVGSSGNITTAGDLALNGGDLTTTGALNITPGGALAVGSTGQALTLQGNASTSLSATSGANTNSLTFAAPSGGSKTITIGNEAGTLCIQNSTNCGFALASGSTNYIQNQISSDQTADFRISGTGRANTSLLTPTLDTATGVALNIATATATSVTIGNATTNTPITLNSGTGAIAIGTGAQNRTISVGTGAAVQGVTIGSSNGASSTVVDCGTGTCSFGATATAHTTTVGSSTSTSVTNIQGGSGGVAVTSGGAINLSPAGNVTIGTSNTTGTLMVLDTKTDAGDPTGANGGMYYNSSTNKFRCYENNTWVDCLVPGGGTAAFVQNGNSFGVAATLGTNDAFALNVETSGTTRLTVGATGGVSLATGNALTVAGGLTSLTAASGSGDALNVSNDSSTGNIAVFKDGATNVAVIADGGAATFQNSTNSTDGFRILNASVSENELVGVDTTNSMLRLLTNNTGHLTGTDTLWNTTTALPGAAARFVPATVTVNGYIYLIGGCDSSSNYSAIVYYSRANSDGTLGAWTATTSLPNSVCGHAATTYNGYIYVNGSTGSATTARDIWYAKPNADGTISAWTTQNDPTNLIGLKDHGMAAYNGYLYITAGESDDGLNTRNRNVYYGRINADGSVPSFTAQSNWLLDQDHNPGQVLIANGYLYVMGSSNYDKFYYGRINANGSVATQALATGTTAARKNTSIAVMNGFMYVIAGGSTNLNTVQYGRIGATGDIAAFTTDTTTLNSAYWLCPKTAVTLNNYVYLFGCEDDATSLPTTRVEFASGTRVKVGGSLDLVGYSGEGMSEGGSGGHLTAGNTFVNGALSVTGNSNFKDGAIVTNNFNVNGLTSLQTTTNSATGFQVLNASGTQQFVIDTTNSRVYVGNVTADSTAALLVLDTKDTAGAPTGVNGGMYYNSNENKFKCYQNSEWRDCVSSVTAGGISNAGPAGSNTTSSTTFASIPGTSSVAITKKSPVTKLTVDLDVGLWVGSVGTKPVLAIRVDGVDYPCGHLYFNDAGKHQQVACSVVISGLTAGAKTVGAYWRVSAGGQTVNIDDNDWISMTVLETD